MSLDPVDGFGHARAGLLDRLTDTFRPLYNLLFDEHDTFILNLDQKLGEARMNQTVEVYLSRAMGYGAICGFILWMIGISLALMVVELGLVQDRTITNIHFSNPTFIAIAELLRLPMLIMLSGVILGTIGFTAIFTTYVAIPYSRAGARKREIDALLPDAVSFMYALSIGGLSQIEIIETMATAESTYGEVSKEFRIILQETWYFDTDYRTAIQKRAANTPSAELSQFFTDMLSIIDSGGSMTEFLDDKKDIHFRHAREDQEQILETLDLISEMYITLSLFPLLLIVILVILDMIGGSQEVLMYATVYVMIPGLGLAFLVIVATIREDEHGSGYLTLDDERRAFDAAQEQSPFNLGLINAFRGSFYVFDRIATQEGTIAALEVVKRPHVFFRTHPFYTVAITVPASMALLAVGMLSGTVPYTWTGVVSEPFWSTVWWVYVPLFMVCIPLAIFWEWNNRRRRAILHGLSEHLRKLSSANATGMTLLESIKVVADTTPGKLGEEFNAIYAKSHYGMHLKESLIVFNNKYHIPRLARTVKLIGKAQEISNQIPSVLSTAARATETQENIERERNQRAMLHVAIIGLTFLTLLAVMALMKSQFVTVMADVSADTAGGATTGQFGMSMDLNLVSLLFFHAVTIQAVLSGVVSGYIRNATPMSGVKYVVVFLLATLGVWVFVA